ncbi:hypothetical protein BDZ89DRAFT_1074975 [Hymenopellis radicata]|nr:hypothetical protein BDZ89DRAFT_1074975 [Hymenopellis radicata]
MAPHRSTCCCRSTQISFDSPELPDDVKAHILSNEPPSASDLPMLREYRLSIDPYLARLDTEIAALSGMQEQLQKELDLRKATLNDLRMERRLLKERQRHISAALSPLRRLPLEIIQEIFLYTLAQSGEPDYTWFNVRDPTDSLWRIRRVCRKWRMAAQYPHLWAGLRLMRDVLDHSRSLPLRIHFIWNEMAPGESFNLGRLILDELVQHSERWQYVSFTCVARAFTQSMSALRGKLPKLEELEFSELRRSRGDHIDDDAHPFEIAPLLTKATISRATFKLDYALTPAAFRVLVSSPYLTYLADRSRTAIPTTTLPQTKLDIFIPLGKIQFDARHSTSCSGLQRLSININGLVIERGALNRAPNELSRPPCSESPILRVQVSIVDMIHVRSGMESVSFTIHPKSRFQFV